MEDSERTLLGCKTRVSLSVDIVDGATQYNEVCGTQKRWAAESRLSIVRKEQLTEKYIVHAREDGCDNLDDKTVVRVRIVARPKSSRPSEKFPEPTHYHRWYEKPAPIDH